MADDYRPVKPEQEWRCLDNHCVATSAVFDCKTTIFVCITSNVLSLRCALWSNMNRASNFGATAGGVGRSWTQAERGGGIVCDEGQIAVCRGV